jgi:UPF0042 nucleotide-binding protein
MDRARLIVVTGVAGAGRLTCLKALEDSGFEAVDNLPLDLAARLLTSGEPVTRDLAIGLDSRTRAFAPGRLLDVLERARAAGNRALLLFLECDDEVLRRRFTETRRRHPLALDRPLGDGIHHERVLLARVKAASDLVIDTSLLSPADFRRLLGERFPPAGGAGVSITIVSFAYRQGLPREADLVFDVRFLDNPHYVAELRPLTGLDPAVQAHVQEDPGFRPFVDGLEGLLVPLLPRYNAEGKSYLTIGIGCTGGRHRSVYVAETLRQRLAVRGWATGIVHRELPAAAGTGIAQ